VTTGHLSREPIHDTAVSISNLGYERASDRRSFAVS